MMSSCATATSTSNFTSKSTSLSNLSNIFLFQFSLHRRRKRYCFRISKKFFFQEGGLQRPDHLGLQGAAPSLWQTKAQQISRGESIFLRLSYSKVSLNENFFAGEAWGDRVETRRVVSESRRRGGQGGRGGHLEAWQGGDEIVAPEMKSHLNL